MPEAFTEGDHLEPFVTPAWVNKTAAWIKGHARGLLAAAVIFQLLVLVSMIAIHAVPFIFGERILLKVQPVDPRDLFRGDYVVLRYGFSRVPPGGIAGAPTKPYRHDAYRTQDSWWNDRAVYVSLEPEADGKHYRASGVSVDRPNSGRYIKGKFTRGWRGTDLHFGIEAFYVQEGEGRRIERLRNANQLSAEIALTPWGQARLCGVR